MAASARCYDRVPLLRHATEAAQGVQIKAKVAAVAEVGDVTSSAGGV